MTPPFLLFNPTSAPLPYLPSPFVRTEWCRLLHGYPGDLLHIINGILLHGCLVAFSGLKALINSRNLSSANEDLALIDKQIITDLALWRLAVTILSRPIIISPIRLVPKYDGGFRRICHLSFPLGNSVSDGIPTELAALSHLRLKEVFSLVLQAGRSCVITKRNIKDVFWNIPTTPSSQWLFRLYWRDVFYKETYLPFSPATAPFIFNLFTKALHSILQSVLSISIVIGLVDFYMLINHSMMSQLQA